MKLKDLLTKKEVKEVSAQNRALLAEARARAIPVTNRDKRAMWQMLINKKVAGKQYNAKQAETSDPNRSKGKEC
jgi:hypothetical protein